MEGRIVPVLAGCTASGKSRAAMSLSEEVDIEIVNADSRQVYRWMDIGTAKPDRKDLERVRHHLIDIVDPDESFSAGEFSRLATEAVDGVFSSGSTPLLVGVSGL